jgi:osmotically-inducible protein OsmY
MRVEEQALQVPAQSNEQWLLGHLTTEKNRRLAENQARLVPEVRSLHNQLIADNDLAMEIAAALAASEMTRGLPIGVFPCLGELHLRGVVRTTVARQAAEKIAAEVPGVKAIHNELVISENIEFLPTLAGVNGREDIVPSKADAPSQA